MKRKLFSILLTVAFVAGLILIPATPAAASPGTLYVRPYTLGPDTHGTSVWSTAQSPTGSASVLLTHTTGTGSVYVDFVPPAGETLATFQADITAATPAWSFRHFLENTGVTNGPQFELRFTESGGTGWLEVTAVGLQGTTGTAGWLVETLAGATVAGYGGNTADGTSVFEWGPLTALSGIEAAVNASWEAAETGTTASAYVLTRVRVELWEDIDQYCHIDDITIAGVPYYGLIKDAIDSATAADTISVAAGTYDAETTWPIAINKQLTIQGAAGATSIIDPGSAGQGVIAISTDNVTLDGFTIIHGTQTYSSSNPVENTVWVDAEYSTIKNNTITGAPGTANIYIGGRTSPTEEDPGYSYAKYEYVTGQPLGHVIQDNAIDKSASAEGWGIFAVELTDSLIHGNSFTGSSDVGDDRATAWGATAGTPGTCIIIHSATAGTATGSPGGGYVIVEDNTASWVKYTFLNFVAGIMIADVDGKFYEKAVAGTVDKVIVRDNTATNIGKNSTDYSGGNIVNFAAEAKNYDNDPAVSVGASLTIGANKVTIGPGNTFQTADNIINIKNPKTDAEGKHGVLGADNIVVIHSNLVGAESYGIYNGTTHDDQDLNSLGGDKVIVAKNNWWGNASGPVDAVKLADTGYTAYGSAVTASVTYEPWLLAAAVTDVTPTTYTKTLALKNPWTLVSVDKEVTTGAWVGTTVLSGSDTILAYKYTAGSGYTDIDLVTQLTSVDAYYIKTSGGGGVGINYSTSSPGVVTKSLGVGWNIISCAAETDAYELLSPLRYALIGEQEGTGLTTLIGQASYNQYLLTTFSNTLITAAEWTAIDGTPVTLNAFDGYWVYMNAAKSFGVIPD